MTKKLKPNRLERGSATTPASIHAQAPATSKAERDTLDEQQVQRIARAIADPRRMALLRAIAQKTSSCADLRQAQPISAATLSHHMRELEQAGLIETSKHGRKVHATLQKKIWKSYVSSLKALAG